MPAFGLLCLLTLLVTIYFSPADFFEWDEQEPMRAVPDEIIISPDGSKKLVFARFLKLEADEMPERLFSGIVTPYADGYIYLTDSKKDVTWLDDMYIAYFIEKFVEG